MCFNPCRCGTPDTDHPVNSYDQKPAPLQDVTTVPGYPGVGETPFGNFQRIGSPELGTFTHPAGVPSAR